MPKHNSEKEFQLNIKKIHEYEEKWISHWEVNKTYHISGLPEKKKYYILVMFPYPSGKIHMGHVRNYSLGDVLARYKRLRGYQVLHPIGWDSFGLPAENAAIKNNIAPARWTYSNIDTMRSQLKRMGFSYDWGREITTCSKEYYHWNQYIFLQFLKKGWAYKKKAWVNWCEKCSTVLANEQVVDGACWRHEDTGVQKKVLSQWFFKITDFANDLIEDHSIIENGWPDRVLSMQKNWIGKSKGALVEFKLSSKSRQLVSKESPHKIKIFTTRLDTIFGASYLAVAPEHSVLKYLTSEEYIKRVDEFRDKTLSLSEVDRENPNLKEGVYTGLDVEHPFTKEELPVYAGNFVLPQYGTGAVMAVPAHDQRDFEFASKYRLRIKLVISPEKEELPAKEISGAFIEDGFLHQSGKYNSLSSSQARDKMVRDLKELHLGEEKVQYRLRDWLISRQRYWGTPIPIIYCPTCGRIPVSEKDLPVELPQDVDFTGSTNPLKYRKDFIEVDCHRCGCMAKRETDTMDTFVDSSWYFIRYTSPAKDISFLNKKAVDCFMPVDQCIGGIEHTNMHLLYARYFTKAFYSLGLVKTKEPFLRLLTQGMVLKEGKGMSKSLGNVVDPDELIQKYGADTIRIFSLFAAPPEKDMEWSEFAVKGSYRMIKRVYYFITLLRNKLPQLSFSQRHPVFQENDLRKKQLLGFTHRTIKEVTQDIERFSFNTAIAKLMEMLNYLYEQYFDLPKVELDKDIDVLSFSLTSFLILLSPFAPFISLEMLEKLGMKNSHECTWPLFQEQHIKAETFTLIIQVNGRLRDRLEVDISANKEDIISLARGREKIRSFLNKKSPKRSIYVPRKLVNFVI